MERYHRQILLPQIGRAGQERLSEARVLIVGVGALGCTSADLLARAGVGTLILIDRDTVDLTNLHRQTLFTEIDAASAVPKAEAAARRLRQVNSSIDLVPLVADLTSENVRRIVREHRPTLIVDATDNAATRYLLNDLSVAGDLPWVYGGCVGTEGRVMLIRPNVGPCLRCIFPDPPSPGELPTCDTAGVLGSAASVVASLQATEVIRHITKTNVSNSGTYMISLDVWERRFKTVDFTNARRADCPACGRREFDFLNAATPTSVTLCGRDTVQIKVDHFAEEATAWLEQIADRLTCGGMPVERTPWSLRTQVDHPDHPSSLQLTIFRDGRVLVHGTANPAVARTVVDRLLG